MVSVKTVTLSGAPIAVEGLAGQNTIVQNLGSSAVYVSTAPGIKEGADGTAEIPAGGALNIYGTFGTLWLKGTGKVQLTGTDYSELNCVPVANGSGGSSNSSGDSSGGSGITKGDIDGLFGEGSSGGGSSSGGGGSSGITKGDIDDLF